jgi:hypothetical protein
MSFFSMGKHSFITFEVIAGRPAYPDSGGTAIWADKVIK